MKMKDVISKTDLTDRAIRLYIENGLVTPDFGETNAGRRSLDFSEADVDSLKKIATLRKAGFSIAEIKSLQKGGEECRKTVFEFIKKTTQKIESDTAIVESLQLLMQKETFNINTVCEKLKTPTIDKKLPKEDLKADENEIYTMAGVLGFGAWMIMVLIQFFNHIKTFRFLMIDDYQIFSLRLSIHAFTAFLCVFLITINRKRKKSIKSKNTSGFSFTATLLLIFSIQLVFFNMLFTFVGPSFCSLTTNPKNYLKLDNYVERYKEPIYDLFPTSINHDAKSVKRIMNSKATTYPETTKYYYRHRYTIDPDFDIVAEWQLPEESYKTAKNHATNYVREIMNEEKKGDWSFIYFNEENKDINEYYYFLIFAYNDKTKTVRYIISYCMDAADGTYQPYFLSIDW